MRNRLINFKEFELSSTEQTRIYGASDLSYCSTAYAIRSCNQLDSGAMQGWSYGWAAGGCSVYSGAQLWNAAAAQSIPMDGSCDTGWLIY
ncbi:MAG: hypothetical protein KIT62_10445 [Cyclobacteriaceae bacterium]|nr:hypothetical protein [Cyclobacteriaceae bacterium]